jgi:rod shape-determining protein MreC
MFDYIKRNQLQIAIVITLISFFFILVSQSGKKRVDNWFSYLAQTLVYPFQATSTWVGQGFTGVWGGYIALQGVREENQTLKKTITSLRQDNAKYKEMYSNYQRLQAALKFQQKDPDQKVFAEVIAESKVGHSKVLVINKGSSDGIRKNFAVVTPEGAVGKIQSVTRFQAHVQLITDSHSEFPVLIQRVSRRTKAFLQGKSNGQLHIVNIPRTLILNVGDPIIASGLSGIFPKGALVGKIKSIQKKKFGLFQTVTLKPAVDFNRLEEVFVILNTKKNIYSPLFTE